MWSLRSFERLIKTLHPFQTDDVTITEDRPNESGRVAAWAADFERLLADPEGLATFTEFLEKEFSAENITFWAACEKFHGSCKVLFDRDILAAAASKIVTDHLAPGAPEPVNVDSHARQCAQDGAKALSTTHSQIDPADIFAPAQKQIYNLMKFDSFSRFLKSDLYKEALMSELDAKSSPEEPKSMVTTSEVEKEPPSNHHRLSSWGRIKKGDKSEEGQRRRSLLPWANKDRSKSKDRASSAGATKSAMSRSEESRASVSSTSSVTNANNASFESNNTAENNDCTLARVILPDKATTVVQTRPGETIRAMVSRLLEKRGLRFTSFDVFAMTTANPEALLNPSKPLDLSEESTSLACAEVRVEPRVLFRLELPSKRSIGVKAKPAKVVKDVLGPILSQYGWALEAVAVRRDILEGQDAEDEVVDESVDLHETVASIDNCRLVVTAVTSDEVNARLLEEMVKAKNSSGRHETDAKSNSSRGSNAGGGGGPAKLGRVINN